MSQILLAKIRRREALLLARYRATGIATFQMKLYDALQGPVLSTISMVLILLNVAAVLLESEAWINELIGSYWS